MEFGEAVEIPLQADGVVVADVLNHGVFRTPRQADRNDLFEDLRAFALFEVAESAVERFGLEAPDLAGLFEQRRRLRGPDHVARNHRERGALGRIQFRNGARRRRVWAEQFASQVRKSRKGPKAEISRAV